MWLSLTDSEIFCIFLARIFKYYWKQLLSPKFVSFGFLLLKLFSWDFCLRNFWSFLAGIFIAEEFILIKNSCHLNLSDIFPLMLNFFIGACLTEFYFVAGILDSGKFRTVRFFCWDFYYLRKIIFFRIFRIRLLYGIYEWFFSVKSLSPFSLFFWKFRVSPLQKQIT